MILVLDRIGSFNSLFEMRLTNIPELADIEIEFQFSI